MTRRRLTRTMRFVFAGFGLLIATAAVAKLSGLPQLEPVYQFITDMSFMLVTVIAAYLANVFQQRSGFVTALSEEWKNIVNTKAVLISYCEREQSSVEDYLDAYCHMLRTIDYMRIVYANVGETDELIGYYPYEPLHDMRRALESIDPRRGFAIGVAERAAARDDIWEAFNALRESFLNEFTLEEPAEPILATRARRRKKASASPRAADGNGAGFTMRNDMRNDRV